MSEAPEWAMQFMPLNAAEKAAEIKLNEELKQMQEKIESLLHAECNNRIAVQQERIAALEGMLAENKRVLEIAMGTVARLSAPVSDAEWLDLCAGDALQITDVQRHELDRFIAARTVPLAPQDTEKDGEESQTAIDAVSEAQ